MDARTLGQVQGNSYVHGMNATTCTGDSCYAEVGFHYNNVL